jgi:hypothetical protein
MLAYIGPVMGYFEQRGELRRQQAHLVALEEEKQEHIARLADAEAPEVLQMRAREQGLVLPGERAFAIRGALEPEPAAVEADDDDGGILGWLPDIL